jgi:hypothetical protein
VAVAASVAMLDTSNGCVAPSLVGCAISMGMSDAFGVTAALAAVSAIYGFYKYHQTGVQEEVQELSGRVLVDVHHDNCSAAESSAEELARLDPSALRLLMSDQQTRGCLVASCEARRHAAVGGNPRVDGMRWQTCPARCGELSPRPPSRQRNLR